MYAHFRLRRCVTDSFAYSSGKTACSYGIFSASLIHNVRQVLLTLLKTAKINSENSTPHEARRVVPTKNPWYCSRLHSSIRFCPSFFNWQIIICFAGRSTMVVEARQAVTAMNSVRPVLSFPVPGRLEDKGPVPQTTRTANNVSYIASR